MQLSVRIHVGLNCVYGNDTGESVLKNVYSFHELIRQISLAII